MMIDSISQPLKQKISYHGRIFKSLNNNNNNNNNKNNFSQHFTNLTKISGNFLKFFSSNSHPNLHSNSQNLKTHHNSNFVSNHEPKSNFHLVKDLLKQFTWAEQSWSHDLQMLQMVETWLLQNLLSPHHLFQILVTNHRYNTKYASLIGFCYNWGLGTEINGELAIHFYTIAARKNDHSAAVQNELGWMYEFGFGTEKNPKLAFQYFRKSARQGLPNAQNSLGECYHFGLGTEIDLEKAFSWYSRAAKSECADGQFHLAECYQLGLGCKRDLDLALFWYHLSSSSYNKNESLDYHGKEHDLETNISNSMVLKGMQGFTWFIRAAKAGDARAQRVVGDYYRGWSFNKLNSDENDDSNSISDGRSEGRNKSAEFFSSRNSKTAFKWYEKSASAGNVTAKRRVGLCYRNGIGCEVDLKKSLKCFKEAAELGSWNGMADYEVAWCYQFGIGVEKDIHEGMKWYVCSAKKGYLKGWIEAKKLMAGLMIGNESGTFCRR